MWKCQGIDINWFVEDVAFQLIFVTVPPEMKILGFLSGQMEALKFGTSEMIGIRKL